MSEAPGRKRGPVTYHESPTLGEWAECRAWREPCPFGEHGGIETVIKRAREAHERGEDLPTVQTTRGTVREFSFAEDGGFKLGSRHYDAEGKPVVSAATLRSRKFREGKKLQALEGGPPASAAPELPWPPPSPDFATTKEKLAYIMEVGRKYLDAWGLAHLPFSYNRRESSLGVTAFRNDKPVGIALSRYHMERRPWDEVWSTLAHEAAHALVPYGHHHDEVWAEKAKSLGGEAAAEVRATTSIEKSEHLWVGTCPACGKVTGQATAPRHLYVCSDCKAVGKEHAYVWTKAGKSVPLAKMPKNFRLIVQVLSERPGEKGQVYRDMMAS